MTWTLYAHKYKRNGDTFFMHIGSYNYVKAHGLNEPILEVQATENPEGRYWGWLDAGKDTPSMVWPHEQLFRMCFAYGPEVEVEKGKGRIVRMDIEGASE